MDTTEHVKVTRLRDAAVAGLMLDGAERDHQANCDACQDLFDIFKQQLLDHRAVSSNDNNAKRKRDSAQPQVRMVV